MYLTVRGDNQGTWNNGLLRKVDDIKLKYPQYENLSDISEKFMRLVAQDIALLKVWCTLFKIILYIPIILVTPIVKLEQPLLLQVLL